MATFFDSPLKFPSKPADQPKPDMRKAADPSTDRSQWGPWGSHDPAIFKDPDRKLYYTYSSEGGIRRSKDLISWEYIGNAVTDIPEKSKKWNQSDAIGALAPDIIKVGDEYRLYSAAGTMPYGSHRSSLYLLVGASPEGPFTPRDAVVNSSNEDNLNAIDANPVIEEETGEHYLIYGSFWGGIFALHLNPRNGLAYEEGFGTCIARRPKWADCAIEGPYVKYNPDTGYYYLFVSYGSLKSDYNIRVGRSKCITGPYLDPNGRDMRDVDDFKNEVGFMIACGYRFDDSQGWMAPGHNSVLHDDDGSWYLVHHARPYQFEEINEYKMQVRKMLWTADGWPVVSPECYAGEQEQPIRKQDLIGHYEFIKLTPTIPQGVLNSVSLDILSPEMQGVSSTRNSWALKIPSDAMGRVELGGSMRGYWKLLDNNTLEITYANCTETYQLLPAWDWELNEPTIVLTGKDEHGVACWAKKADLPSVSK